jgi:hypothetical protein
MTRTPCQSAALDRIIALWAANVAEFFGAIAKTILTIAEIVRSILHEIGACCRKPGQRLPALRPRLSWPIMPQLETMGQHARLPHRTGFLPPSASAFHRQPHGVGLDVFLSAQMREASQAEADGDDAEGKHGSRRA